MKTFWLARDKGGHSTDLVFLHTEKPRPLTHNPNIYGFGAVDNFCIAQFTEITGIKIKKGECRQFRLEEIK